MRGLTQRGFGTLPCGGEGRGEGSRPPFASYHYCMQALLILLYSSMIKSTGFNVRKAPPVLGV